MALYVACLLLLPFGLAETITEDASRIKIQETTAVIFAVVVVTMILFNILLITLLVIRHVKILVHKLIGQKPTLKDELKTKKDDQVSLEKIKLDHSALIAIEVQDLDREQDEFLVASEREVFLLKPMNQSKSKD